MISHILLHRNLHESRVVGAWAMLPCRLIARRRPQDHNLNHRRCANFKSHNPASERFKKKEWRLKFTIFPVKRNCAESSITLPCKDTAIVSVGTPPFVGQAQVVRVNLICVAGHAVTTCRLSSGPQPSCYWILIMQFVSHTDPQTGLLVCCTITTYW
jgi:hypothetical protein